MNEFAARVNRYLLERRRKDGEFEAFEISAESLKEATAEAFEKSGVDDETPFYGGQIG